MHALIIARFRLVHAWVRCASFRSCPLTTSGCTSELTVAQHRACQDARRKRRAIWAVSAEITHSHVLGGVPSPRTGEARFGLGWVHRQCLILLGSPQISVCGPCLLLQEMQRLANLVNLLRVSVALSRFDSQMPFAFSILQQSILELQVWNSSIMLKVASDARLLYL